MLSPLASKDFAARTLSPLNRGRWGSQRLIGPACCATAAGRRFSEEDYLLQRQSEERAAWASSVRAATGSRKHQFWEPLLDPPPLLDSVSLVLVSPRRPVSLGTVARAASCFEVSSLRVVAPRCNYVTRHSKSASKGAQYLLYKAENHATVAEAIADCQLSVAFTRWVAGRTNAFYDLSALLAHPTMQALIREPVPETLRSSSRDVTAPSDGARPFSHTAGQRMQADTSGQRHDREEERQGTDQDQARVAAATEAGAAGTALSPPSRDGRSDAGVSCSGRRATRVALVFGREELGLSDEEVDACDCVCSIPIGRLQESLSLSHAVSIALSGIYAQRLAFVAGSGTAGAGPRYVVSSALDLAEGVDAEENGGTEQ